LRRALVATLVLCGACRQASSDPPSGAIFVLVDALRADRLGCYGNPRDTSPNLDALAKNGTLFLNAIAPAPWTLPTMATIWTSLNPSVHGATRTSDLFQSDLHPVAKLDDSRVTLAEVLQEKGFQTAAFVDGSYCRKVFGMSQGFDVFVDAELPGIRLNIEALFDWLDREKPERFFAYVHTVEVHSPYSPAKLRLPETETRHRFRRRVEAVLAEERDRYRAFDLDPAYRGMIDGFWTVTKELGARRDIAPLSEDDQQQLLALYDRGVTYTDHWMGEMIEGLNRRGLLDRAIVVVTADHGDELMDHAGVEHGETFYDEMIRVPLIMSIPGLARGSVIESQVGLVDLMPTLLDLLQVERDLPLQGRSFVSLLKGGSQVELPVFSEASIHPRQRSVRTREWKYIESPGRRELYDLRKDPKESSNVCESRQEICSDLAARLRAWNAENARVAKKLPPPTAPRVEIDEETRRRLRVLGYDD